MKIETNSDFEKVRQFLEDLLVIHGISKNMSLLIFEMIPYLNKEKRLIMNAHLKKEWATTTRMSKGTIENTLSKLNDVGLLIRLDRGTYELHPALHEIDELLKNDKAVIKLIYTEKSREIKTEE